MKTKSAFGISNRERVNLLDSTHSCVTPSCLLESFDRVMEGSEMEAAMALGLRLSCCLYAAVVEIHKGTWRSRLEPARGL